MSIKPKQFKPQIGVATAPKFNGRKHIDDMYDGTWARYRLKFLLQNPRCYSCGDRANVCDHLIPHKGDEKLFRKTDNHIPLCDRCHNFITAKFDTKYIKGQSIDPKLKWISKNRSFNDVTTKVYVLPSYG